jgi:3-isopropylmalate/(R)-2-methylmalate dehydratase large subunit
MAKTLYDKIWDAHLVDAPPGETPVIYIDRHLVHEVTSPQAFEGLRLSGRKVRRPELTLAVADHNVPTKDRDKGITDPESRAQVEALIKNTSDFGVEYFAMDDIRAGIVHIIGPEQGWTLPGTTIVCGDSHTSTMARSARWPSASAPRKSSMCWRPRPCAPSRPRTCASASTASCLTA